MNIDFLKEQLREKYNLTPGQCLLAVMMYNGSESQHLKKLWPKGPGDYAWTVSNMYQKLHVLRRSQMSRLFSDILKNMEVDK